LQSRLIEKVGEIGNDETVEFEIPPGAHAVQLRVDFYKSESIETHLGAGQTVDLTCAAAQMTDIKGIAQPLRLVLGSDL